MNIYSHTTMHQIQTKSLLTISNQSWVIHSMLHGRLFKIEVNASSEKKKKKSSDAMENRREKDNMLE